MPLKKHSIYTPHPAPNSNAFQFHPYPSISYSNLQPIPLTINLNNSRITHLQLSPNNLVRHPIPNLLANQPIQRSRAESRIVASFSEPVFHGVVDGEDDPSVVETGLQFFEADVDDIAQGGGREPFEDYEFVDAVEEFGGVWLFVRIWFCGMVF